jgi:hypothetical protein
MAGEDFGCAHGAMKTGMRAANEFMSDIPELKFTKTEG